MGKHSPTSPTFQDMLSVKLDNTWSPNDTTCCPVSDDGNGTCRKAGFGWPDNDEFTWGGLGDDCNSLCAWDYSRSCDTAGIAGKRPRVKRKAYLADPLKCCLGSAKYYDNKTCDPANIGPSTSSCKQILAPYCTGSNAFDDVSCREWCITNPASCTAGKIDYCSKNMNSAVCQAYSKSLSQSGDGSLDSYVKTFCDNNYFDDFCACMVKPVYTGGNADLQILNSPQCYDNRCISSGYLNSNQRAFKCPGSICSNTIVMANVTSSDVDHVVQSCSQSSSSSPTTTTTTVAPTIKKHNNTIMYIIIFLVVILGIAITAIIAIMVSS